jgi:cystathionine gamma-synthase
LRDLLKKPIWKNLELGYAIPDSIHAVSVALPTWNDVINYEEKKSRMHEFIEVHLPKIRAKPHSEKIMRKSKPGKLLQQ